MSSLLKVSAADWKNKVYYCKAGYKPNEIKTAEWQKPQPQPPKLSSLVPSREVIHSQANAVLGCVISGFPPDNVTVSWKKAGSAQAGIVLPSTPRSNGTFETITYLSVPVQEWTKKQKYTCEVKHAPSGFSRQINMTYKDEICTDLTGEEGKEEQGQVDGDDNVLTVAAFAILFIISFLYSTFVNIVKVQE
ncbi:pancreatic IgW, short secretory form-like [Hemitrygon akajei]|uniref:pancreatic IgW, short secretory form-like n=1 Tax=Hemitrygon akajei TaxID=2704970 RepID=UPI003BF9DF11